MSPTGQLKKEHEAIRRMLNVLDTICERLDVNEAVDPNHLAKIVEFFKVFADKCHHSKEEALLFPAMEQAGIPRNGGPIGVMLLEHDTGRGYVRGMAESAGRYRLGVTEDGVRFAEHGRDYIALLSQHIDKEDNILFPMADRVIPVETKDTLLQEFERVEEEVVGAVKHEEFHALLEELSQTYRE